MGSSTVPAAQAPAATAGSSSGTATAGSSSGTATPAGSYPHAPFGAGVPVSFDSDRPLVDVYVARGTADPNDWRVPDAFVKVGRTPLEIELPPGDYTVLAEGFDVTTASSKLSVGTKPLHVRVRVGKEGLHDTSTLFFATGLTALLAGVIVEVSYSKAENGIDKSKIAVPLFASGAVLSAAGFGFFFASKTSFENLGGPSASAARRQGFHVGVTRAF